MDENSTEIKIDHHNGPDPEVEKRLEEESAAALPQKDSAPDDLKPDEEVVISTKKANLEVEATEGAEVTEPAEAPKTETKPTPEPAKTADESTKKANTLTVAIVVVLFLIALAVVGAVLAVRYFGK